MREETIVVTVEGVKVSGGIESLKGLVRLSSPV